MRTGKQSLDNLLQKTLIDEVSQGRDGAIRSNMETEIGINE